LPAGVHQRALSFGGQDRSYELQVPASYDNLAPVALVFDIHGYTGDKDVQESYSGVSALAEAEGFAVVRPNGTGILRSWNAGELCCGTAAASGVDDVGALRAIAAEVSASLCVDARRIYATGISNGGAMSHRLACEAADVFAAVAPVAWPIALSPFSACVPSRPIAVMHAHGTGDLIVPFHGGWGKPSSPDSFAYWASVNGCSGPPAVTFAQGQSQCETYARCAGGVEVTLCAIDGGHILYENAAGVPVAAFAWEFLSRFSLP
jgi:polyhydroxybutyrate depolymerase